MESSPSVRRDSQITFIGIYYLFFCEVVHDRALVLMGCVSGEHGVFLISFQLKVYVEIIVEILETFTKNTNITNTFFFPFFFFFFFFMGK